MVHSLRSLAAAVALATGLGGLAPPAHATDAFNTMASDPRFSRWVELLQQAGIAPYARAGSPYTVFVPTNDALGRLPSSVMQSLLPTSSEAIPDSSRLIAVVRSHAIPGLHRPSEFTGQQASLRTVNGLPIRIGGTDPNRLDVAFEYASGHTSGPPIQADNALIYPMDFIAVR